MKDKSRFSIVRFCELLGILFIVMKLFGLINWPWWVVLSPLWILPAVVIVLVIILVCEDGLNDD